MSEFTIVSPVDGRPYHQGRFADDRDVGGALEAATGAAASWRNTPVAERKAIVDALVGELVGAADELALMTAWQMGRPLAKADETGDLRFLHDFYASTAQLLDPLALPGDANERRSLGREPFGVTLSICAWNYPVVMLSSLVIAPLLAGNVVLFKHSPQTARISEVIKRSATRIGVPAGVLQALDLTNAQCATLLGSGGIGLVSFVGSTRGGAEVRQAAAGALVQEILELGGKDAAYVRADADLDWAAAELARASFTNSGQSCCSVERIYVDDAVHDAFVDRLVAAAEEWTIGHPIEDRPALGPLVRADAARRVEADVAAAVAEGARLVLDPSIRDLAGTAYVTPKVLVEVDHSMELMRSETFGPVAPIVRVRGDAEAIALMNDTSYGLTGSIWTADLDRGATLADELRVGNAYVNQADYVDQFLPWGGVGASGIGTTDGVSWVESLTRPKGLYARQRPAPDIAAGQPDDRTADR